MFKVLVALFLLFGIVYALPNPGYLGLSAPAAAIQLQPAAVQLQAAVAPVHAAALPVAYASAPLATSYAYQNQQQLQPAALAIPSYSLAAAAAHLG